MSALASSSNAEVRRGSAGLLRSVWPHALPLTTAAHSTKERWVGSEGSNNRGLGLLRDLGCETQAKTKNEELE